MGQPLNARLQSQPSRRSWFPTQVVEGDEGLGPIPPHRPQHGFGPSRAGSHQEQSCGVRTVFSQNKAGSLDRPGSPGQEAEGPQVPEQAQAQAGEP